VQRILVRLPNWLGDVLLARPLLFALRRSFPQAEITGVAPGGLLELIAADATLDRAEAWPPSGAGQSALVHRTREWRPEAALVLPPSFSSAWFALRIGAPRRIGYRHELRGLLLTEALPRAPRGDVHLADEYLALGARIGAVTAPVPALRAPVAGDAEAAELLRTHGLDHGPLALLAPGAIYGPAKRWAPERFAAVGRSLREAGHAIAVCGTAAEAAEAAQVASAIGAGAVSLAGLTSLPTLAGLCARATLAVCNDSGLAHLAAACGARTVVIFGSTSPAWTAPRAPRVRIVQRAPVCAPCFQRTCRIGYRCLTAIEDRDVLAAVEATA